MTGNILTKRLSEIWVRCRFEQKGFAFPSSLRLTWTWWGEGEEHSVQISTIHFTHGRWAKAERRSRSAMLRPDPDDPRLCQNDMKTNMNHRLQGSYCLDCAERKMQQKATEVRYTRVTILYTHPPPHAAKWGWDCGFLPNTGFFEGRWDEHEPIRQLSSSPAMDQLEANSKDLQNVFRFRSSRNR